MRTPRTTTFDTDELETIRQVLAEIDDRLQGLGNRVRGGVIDVITALRGPDVIHVDAVIHKERGTTTGAAYDVGGVGQQRRSVVHVGGREEAEHLL
jgi:hypothetical protein